MILSNEIEFTTPKSRYSVSHNSEFRDIVNKSQLPSYQKFDIVNKVFKIQIDKTIFFSCFHIHTYFISSYVLISFSET